MTSYGLKIVLLGDEGVGKSSLIVRYVKNKFKHEYISTMGVDFLIKNLTLPNEDSIKMVVWDIGGQQEWKAKLHLYLQGSDGAIIVSDLTRKKTLTGLNFWFDAIEKHLKIDDLPIVIVGNKLDLEKQRKVSSEELKNASTHPTFETSAKTGETVEEMFSLIAEKVIAFKKKKKKK